MKIKITLMILLFTFTSVFADELDIDESNAVTFGTKRGIKKTKKKLLDKNLIDIKINCFDPLKKEYRELRNLTEVSTDQQFAITIKAKKDVYLYIFNIDSGNNLGVLFPHPSVLKKNPVKVGENFFLPDTKDLMFEFTGKPGIERIFVFASTESHNDFFACSNRIPYDGLNFGTKGHIQVYKTILSEYEKWDASKKEKLNERQAYQLVLIHKRHPEHDVDIKLYQEAKRMLAPDATVEQ